MKKIVFRSCSYILMIAILVSAFPMNGFAALADEISWNLNENLKTTDSIKVVSEGITEEDLRDPFPNSSDEEPSVAGALVDVGQYYKTFLDETGIYTSVITGTPNYYMDEKGNAVDYDNTLIKKNQFFSSSIITNKSSNIKVALSENFTAEGISFEYNGVNISLIPIDGDYSAYSVVGNAIRYNNVFDGVDVQYTVNKLGVNEYIILNKYVNKNFFTYKLNTNGNTVEIADNSLIVKAAGSNDIAYTVSAPIMSDAAGKTSDNIALSLEGDILTVAADTEWLSDLGRAYPVIIDPDIKIDSGIKVRTAVASGNRMYGADNFARGYAGYIKGNLFGFDSDLMHSLMLIHIDDSVIAQIPSGARIENATFNIYQYVGYPKLNTTFWCYRINDPWSITDYSSTQYESGLYNKAVALGSTAYSSSATKDIQTSKNDDNWHHFDIKDIVNSWVNEEAPQYGLKITTENKTEGEGGGAFYTETSNSGVAGQGNFNGMAPYVTISWAFPNPVPSDYPINDTTIRLRSLMTSNINGELAFQGMFADGVAAPNAAVHYWLSDSSKEYMNGYVAANSSYIYPDTFVVKNNEIWNKLPANTTKYRRYDTNWQTIYPFVDPTYNTLYYISAQAAKNGVTGNTAQSDKFLVYKVTQYDTLRNIANYYGVPVEQIVRDNNVQDMLLVENNTIVIINPTQNSNNPYNPPALSEADKRKIDGLLMGRGKHCEFGYEPVNLNTGNFYMDQTDISISDLNGDFSISRTYNSKAYDINSVFGRGWQFDYAEQLTKHTDGSISYCRGDGSIVNFYPDGNGKYICDIGYYLYITPIIVGTKTAVFDGIYEENIDNENSETVRTGEYYYSHPETYNIYEYEIKDSSGEVRRFGSDGHLISITDKKGFKTTLDYNEKGLLTSIVSAGGTTYGINCDSMGRITAVSVPGGTIKYAYNASGDLESYTDENGNVTIYKYDAGHKMTSWIDADGHVVTANVYDDKGRVIKQTDSEGNVTCFTYSDGKTTVKDANDNVTVYNYDDQYRTTSIVYADGSAEYKFYDANNNLTKTTDRAGNSITYEYNSDGFVTKLTRSVDNASQSYVYNKNNDIIKFTDYDGYSVISEYDTNGDLIASTDKNGNTEKFSYDSMHRILSATDAKGNTTKFTYGDIWVSSTTDAKGNTSSYYYNGRGQVVTSVNALGEETRYMYDAVGRNTGIQYPDGTSETYIYEKSGSLKSLKTANDRVYNYTSDGIGNVLTLTDPAGGVVIYTYDGLYNNTSVSYPDGSKEKTSYDAFGNKLSVTDEENNTVTYTYDKASNILTSTDAMGNVTSYTYDMRFNKPLIQTDALGNQTTYEYDKIGNLLSVTFANGSKQTYEYDANGNVVKFVAPNGLITVYEYDVVGNKIKESTNAGNSIEYVYDEVYNPISVTYNCESTKKFTYDALGRVLTETDASGSSTSYKYDSRGNILLQKDVSGRSISYTYDGVGNILTETDSDNGVTAYTYDALDRVVKTTDALGNSTLTEYDSVGNMVVVVDALGFKTENSYNKTGLAVRTKAANGGITTFAYDKNGNIIKTVDADGNVAEIEYDALNRVIKTIDPLGLVTEFRYDSMGNMVSEKNNNGTNNRYTYDALGNVTSTIDALEQKNTYKYDLNGNLIEFKAYDGTTTSYTYDLFNNRTSVTYPDSTKDTYTYDLIGNMIEMSKNGREYKYLYDKANRLVSTTDPLSQTTSYEYNIFDLVTKTTNPDGSTILNTYDKVGNLLSSTDGNGNTTTYTYDALYRLNTASFADDSTNTYIYDSMGNLTSFTDNNGNETQYKYSVIGYVTAKKSPNGAVTNYVNDAVGNVLSETDALDNTTKYTYNKAGQLLSQKLANGAEYTIEYDALGRTVKSTEPVSLSTTYTYDSKGDVASVTDQSGRITAYTYDAMHRITSSTDAMGNTTNFVYDVNGNLSSLISAKGAVIQYAYDDIDQLTSELDPAGKLSEYSYDPVGNLTSITETGGRVTSYTYDNAGNVTSETNAKGHKKSYSYDSVYNLVAETDFKGNAVSYNYDKNSNLLSYSDRLGYKTVYTYDEENNLTSYTDPELRKTTYSYDKLNRLTSVTEADSITSAYTYDEVGNVIYAAGYKYSYDLAGNVTSATDALGNVTEYVYNQNGMLETIKNADDTKVNYDYDEIDNLIKKSYDENTVALYTYDADGNRISMDDIAGVTGYEYDQNGRITAVDLSNGTSKIAYEYDVYGNITKLIYPDGTFVTYKYDEINQLVALTNRENKTTSYKYDENGNVTEIHRPNDTYTLLSYDKNDRVTSIDNYGIVSLFGFNNKTVLVSSYDYAYNKSGNITNETKSVFTSGSACSLIEYIMSKLFNVTVETSYAYDNRNQLTQETEKTNKFFSCHKISTTTYEYDDNGNRILKSSPEGTLKYEYNKAGELVKEITDKGTIKYYYDDNGNLVKVNNPGWRGKTETYEYNNENQLTAVKEDKTLLLAALYDGDGERIFTVTSNSIIDTPCVDDKNAKNLKKDSNQIDINDELIINSIFIPNNITSCDYGRYDVTGYINDLNTEYTQVLMEYGANEKVTAAYEYGAHRESAGIDGKQYYYEYDGRGSVSALTDHKGKAITSYSYDAYGNMSSKGKNIANPYGYNAEYTDETTDLQYLRARYYNPNTGTFTSADTYTGKLTEPLSLNRYIYAHNNPVSGRDPSGHGLIGALVGGIIGAAAGAGGEIVRGVTSGKGVNWGNVAKKAATGAAVGAIAGMFPVAATVVALTAGSAKLGYDTGTYIAKSIENNKQRKMLAKSATGSVNGKVGTGEGLSGSRHYYYDKYTGKTLFFASYAEMKAYKSLCEGKEKLSKDFASTAMHDVLNLTAAIPGGTEVSLLANSALYLTEGDYGTATETLVALGGIKFTQSKTGKKFIDKLDSDIGSIKNKLISSKKANKPLLLDPPPEQKLLPAPEERLMLQEGNSNMDPYPSEAHAPVGNSSNPLKFSNNHSQSRNSMTNIYGREYSGHALDRMQEKGIMPSVVENTIHVGMPSPGNRPGTIAYYDPINNISAILNESGRVVTTYYGHHT